MAIKQGLRRKTHFLGTKIKSLRKRNHLTLEDLSVRCVQIDAEAGEGYRLTQTPDRLYAEEILAELDTRRRASNSGLIVVCLLLIASFTRMTAFPCNRITRSSTEITRLRAGSFSAEASGNTIFLGDGNTSVLVVLTNRKNTRIVKISINDTILSMALRLSVRSWCLDMRFARLDNLMTSSSRHLSV